MSSQATSPRKTSIVLTLLVATVPLVAPLRAQQPEAAPAPHIPVVTVNARLVVLDVVVTDASGKPVTGLTEKDFQVLEDGKPQRIRSVESPSAHTLPADTVAAGLDATFDPAAPASFGRSPVTVLILDQANTHFADSSFARRQLHDFLTRQPALLPQPTTLLTLYDQTYKDQHFKQLQGFTRSRDLLLKALAAAPTKYAWELEINGNTEQGPLERLDQGLRALEQIAQSTATIPGRKNLVWVGGGFPTIAPTTLDDKDAQEVKDTLRHITDVLLDTRVTLYAVDPGSSAAGLTEITDPTQALFADAAGDSLSGSFDPFNSEEDFDKLGPVTGGRILRGRNDVAALIASSVELGANFYTIAYQPSSSAETAASFRKIQVLCLRPGLTATTRDGYYTGNVAQQNTALTAEFDLSNAAASALQLNGLRVTVAPDPTAGMHRYIVRVATPGLTWKPSDDGSSIAAVYILAAAFDAKGNQLAHVVHPMKATAKPDTDLRDATRQADFAFEVPPSAKAARLRFVVRDSVTGRMGTAELALPTR